MRGDVVRAFLEALRQAYPDDAAAGGNMDTDSTGDN
jgi:hypothetical protein